MGWKLGNLCNTVSWTLNSWTSSFGMSKERTRSIVVVFDSISLWKRGFVKNIKNSAPAEEQMQIVGAVADKRLAQINFGVIAFPNATLETFAEIKRGYEKIKTVMRAASGGQTAVRFGVFTLIPIAQYRSMRVVYSQSELWNFYTPAY